MTSRRTTVAALLAPFLLLAACGHSPDTQFLTLDPVPGTPGAGAAYRGAPVRIPSLQIPAALDRVEFARETGPGEMKVEDFVHWSASLWMLARDTLILDLAQRLPSGAVSPPDAAAQPGGLRATVAILSFGVAGTEASMVATYAFGPEDGQAGTPHWVQLSAPSAGSTPPETARAFSALLGILADRMAGDMTATLPRR
jgi:uncharacterized lipoprotein YmbA